MTRATQCEELIRELGGEVDDPTTEDFDLPGDEIRSRRRHPTEKEDGNPPSQQEEINHSGTQEAESEVPLTKEGHPDQRFKSQETEEQFRARHMLNVPEGQTDGRGEVTDPEHDLRLKKNLNKRAAKANEDD